MHWLSSKKLRFSLVVVFLYVSTLLLGALCSAGDPSGHNHSTKIHHSLSCLLACASMVSYDTLSPPIPHGLPLAGTIFIFVSLVLFPVKTAILRSRAPPCFS